MENASKALVMAAGVLIAIIVIALLYSFINTVSTHAEQEDLEELRKQTESFNKEYEAFEKKLMRGTDLISVINKAITNNKKNEDNDVTYFVDIIFTLKKELKVNLGGTEGSFTFAKDEKYSIINKKYKTTIEGFMKQEDPDGYKDFKRRFFKCDKIGYNQDTGRVNELEFSEILTESLEGY